MKKNKLRQFKKSEKGMAFVESIPVLFTVVVLFNFSLGFFGAVHSGILNSIASYNYTLETFRFRSDLMYFRPGADPAANYFKTRNRVHGVIQEGYEGKDKNSVWPATIRSIAFTANIAGNESSHRFQDKDTGIWSVLSTTAQPSSEVTTPQIWIKTVYGICLNADCKSN